MLILLLCIDRSKPARDFITKLALCIGIDAKKYLKFHSFDVKRLLNRKADERLTELSSHWGPDLIQSIRIERQKNSSLIGYFNRRAHVQCTDDTLSLFQHSAVLDNVFRIESDSIKTHTYVVIIYLYRSIVCIVYQWHVLAIFSTAKTQISIYFILFYFILYKYNEHRLCIHHMNDFRLSFFNICICETVNCFCF